MEVAAKGPACGTLGGESPILTMLVWHGKHEWGRGGGDTTEAGGRIASTTGDAALPGRP